MNRMPHPTQPMEARDSDSIFILFSLHGRRRGDHAVLFCLNVLMQVALLALLCLDPAQLHASTLPLREIVDLSVRTNLLSDTERQWLKEHDIIRLAPHRKYQPLESVDGKTNGYHGMVAEYVRIMESRLGHRFNFVVLSDDQWRDLDPEKRGADVVPATSETPERAKYWSYTQPYLSLPTYLITRIGRDEGLKLKDFSGYKVAVVGGWAAENYVRDTYPEVIVFPVRDVATGLRSVSFGLVEAFVSELPVATEWLEREGITNLKISGDAGHTYHIRMGIRKDWPELRTILDKAMATITPEEREKIYKRWIKIHAPAVLDPRWRQYAIWGGASLLAVLLLVAAWNRSLTHKVQARTSDLNAELQRRLEADKLLRSSEEKFSKAFRSGPLAMCITTLEEGRIIEANAAFLRMFRIEEKAQAIGKTTQELGLWSKGEEREKLVARLRKEGRILNLKRPFQRCNGEPGTGLFSVEWVDLADTSCVIVLMNDITELERSELERHKLLRRLHETEEEERRRIARELHDTTAQHLAAIQMNLTRLRGGAPDSAESQLLADSLALTTQSVQEIRTLTYLLHPPLLDELGLAGALADYAKGFSKRCGLEVELEADGFKGRLPREMELALFRVAQESLTNAHRHSGGNSALIRLDRDNTEVRLEVQDTGRGLAHDVIHGVGMRGMQERLQQLGGALHVESDSQGTTVLASIPLESHSLEE